MKLPIAPNQLFEIVARIRETEIPYLIVGGQAVVSSHVFSETQDLDVMIAVRDFDETIRRLGEDPQFGTPEAVSWVAKYEIYLGPREDDYVEFDLLNGKKYCGARAPDEFFDYLRHSWTVWSELGPSAKIPVVWYTRLMVRDSGEKYVRKVIRDLRAGASKRNFDDTLKIADFCETREEIERRIARAREILAEIEEPKHDPRRE